jgi:hypothetical protein
MADVQRTLATADSRPAVERILPWLVAGTAAAVILIEIALTRLFSVLLYYHYSRSVPLRPKVDLPRRLRQKNKRLEAFVGAQLATASLDE